MTPTTRLFQFAQTKRYLRRQFWKRMVFVVCATIFAWLAMVYYASPADARAYHRPHHAMNRAPVGVIICDLRGCRGEMKATITITRKRKAERALTLRSFADANGNAIIGGRPSGCPWAYCGCGLRKYLGLSDTRLNLAWNWPRIYGFSHTPHDGDFAARHHHVMLIERLTGPMRAVVRDYNSGRHLSYLHERDLHGYVFGHPGGGRIAANESP